MPRDSKAAAPKSSGPGFLVVALVVIIAAALFAAWFRSNLGPGNGKVTTLLDIPLPPIQAAGWVNGPPPTDEELAGKVVVVEAWATWCGPCWQRAPEFVKTYDRYKDRGVVFIGLTSDTEEVLPAIQEFVDENKIPWPNGYGADDTLVALENRYIPASWVVAPNGKIIWRSETSDGDLEAAIDRALAMQEPEATASQPPPAD